MEMKQLSIKLTLLTLIAALPLTAYSGEGWYDTFYQYRIPVEVEVEKAGWNVVPLSESDITTAINKLEEYSFDPLFLAYNQVKVVGQETEAGFYLVPDSTELMMTDTTLPIPTEKNAYYMVKFVSEGGEYPPTVSYEQTFPVGEAPRTHAYMSSYVPRVLPKKKMTHECLLQSDGQAMHLNVNKEAVAGKDISVRKMKIAFLANFKTSGKKKLVLYYQPLDALYLKIPTRRRDAMPQLSAKVGPIKAAQKYIGKTKYGIGSNAAFDLWFADTTVKLTPNTPLPDKKSDGISISTAANEAQSFQIVVAPKISFDFTGVSVTDLSNDTNKIESEKIEVQAIEYVPVSKKARMNQVKFFAKIGDPLVAVGPKKIVDGNAAFWVTVRTPAGTPAGIYKGELTIQGKSKSSMSVPLSVEVYDFELPEYSTFHTHMGGQYFAKDSNLGLTPIMKYHGLKTKAELKKISRKYYDLMSINKFYPKAVTLYTEIGMKWSPPPEGYNVDKPGNYFTLYDWDFTEFNNELKHYINNLKVNSICLTHTNPSVSNIFKHLPGAEAKVWDNDPGHVTMGWQTFREMTPVTYNKKPGDGWYDTSVEVTRDQWDHLVLDYYRAMAKNLEEHGWLDKFYIMIDESSGTEKILHLVKLLKSDPMTTKIRIAHCLQGFECLSHQENGEYVFTKWLSYIPQIDENYHRWEDYFWDDYGVPRDRGNLWSYAAYSSRLSINSPGMTNREIGLEIFNKGGNGYVIWDTIMWHHTYGGKDNPQNPWIEPYTRLANGALSYFYPPSKAGISPKPDYTIVPSLRVMTYRESVDDYEYARILEDLIADGEKKGVDVSGGKKIIADIERMFPSSVTWSLNDAWYIDLRNKMAKEVVNLKKEIRVKR
jgi:Glycoside hydrolase 123, catalytic domain/Glycoside hydrolase 123 N-terminal domain